VTRIIESIFRVDARATGLSAINRQQLVLQSVIHGATDARKFVATRLQPAGNNHLKKRLQCRKTLRIPQYCPSHNWSYNARVLKA
jgi:hypothetical protein